MKLSCEIRGTSSPVCPASQIVRLAFGLLRAVPAVKGRKTFCKRIGPRSTILVDLQYTACAPIQMLVHDFLLTCAAEREPSD